MSKDIPDGPKASPWLLDEETTNQSKPAGTLVADSHRMTYEEPGPQGELLTVAQRAALLRAARLQLAILHDQCEAIHAQGDQVERINVVLEDISRLEEGIAWLWRYTIA